MRYAVRTVYLEDQGFDTVDTELVESQVLETFDSLRAAIHHAEHTCDQLEAELEDGVSANVEVVDSMPLEAEVGDVAGGAVVWRKEIYGRA